MIARSQDDCFISQHRHFDQNVDYMSPADISNFHLHTCWRENNSVSVKKSQDDISSKIPSSISRRLENVAWRRWMKQIWNLPEAPPSVINWNKQQDVTWLFGPKYSDVSPFEETPLTQANLKLQFSCDDYSDMADEVSSVGSGRSMSFDDRSSVETAASDENLKAQNLGHEEEDAHVPGLKSALKTDRPLGVFAAKPKKQKKRVKFHYLVNSREYMNGHSFDYHFLDSSCL